MINPHAQKLTQMSDLEYAPVAFATSVRERSQGRSHGRSHAGSNVHLLESFAEAQRAHPSCWTGRTGKDYLLAQCAKELLFTKDNQVVLLAKETDTVSGIGEISLWVGQAGDLIDDPAARMSYRSALAEMDHAYVIEAPHDESALHILLWDLEKAVLNINVHVA